MALDVELLRSSFELITTRQPDVARLFYDELFERYPQVRPLFSRNAPEAQQRMLAEALSAVLDHLEDADWLQSTLASLGAKHAEYGVTPEMYDWVGECLLATFARVGGADWAPAHEAAWTAAYTAVTGLMAQPIAHA
jgi:hemoglobin-like flavoprotein